MKRIGLRFCTVAAGICAWLVAGCGSGIPVAPPSGGSTPGGLTSNPTETGGQGGTVSNTCEAIGSPASSVHRQMLDALNSYRRSHGLATLYYSKTLEAAADDHAEDLYRRNFFDHQNPDGEMPWDRAEEAGYCNGSVGENIASGYPTVAAVQVGWQNSPGHNENMLRSNWEHVGMGYYASPDGNHYWVQLFGAP